MIIVRAFLFAILICGAAAAETSRTFLRRVEFEPRRESVPLGIPAGAAIDDAKASQTAGALRQALSAQGYRDAKVEATLVPRDVRQVDLRLRVDRGSQYRIRDIRFHGSLALPASQLRRASRLQGAPYSEAAVESGLVQLRAFLVSGGFFDAQAKLESARFTADKVALTISLAAGPRYRIGHGEFPARGVCACLLEARSRAEKDGALEFDSRVELDPTGHETAAYRLTTGQGPSYKLGRIEFRGQHALGDITLRRTLGLDEGAVFDAGRLRRSLARLDRLPLLEPASTVELAPDAATRTVAMTVQVRERARGRWSLSGPAIPAGLAGPFQAMLSSRLPVWSTWYALAAVSGWPRPLSKIVPFAPARRLFPYFGIGRPYLPGRPLLTGFFYSPQLGWKSAVASYGTLRVQAATHALLRLDSSQAPALAVPVSWTEPGHPDGGFFVCEPPRPRLAKVRAVAGAAVDFIAGAGAF